MKLMSMTNFVISQWDKDITREDFAQSMINYATFLKQPLTLGMFVPCDENGKVLKAPASALMYRMQCFECTADEMHQNRIYNEAKEKVLFEVTNISIDNIKYYCNIGESVEYLAGLDFYLTESVIKQIRL